MGLYGSGKEGNGNVYRTGTGPLEKRMRRVGNPELDLRTPPKDLVGVV